ncbi:MAG TPA: CpsD/CapB family tyrosine-protein kinase [Vicinamibacterales bacterium]|nr:CpsD/CapB family tyrosine-protein kinase [Vicinamibacterales bacterium]
MTRIQNILEKAEREGAVRRLRTDVGVDVAPEPAIGYTPLNGSSTLAPPSPMMHAPAIAPPASPTLTPSRVVAGAHLDPRLITGASTDTAVAEQYRALRTRILHADTMTPTNVVLITSPGRGEGKTLTVGNLGLAMAQEWQRRICIVDADLRHPQMHRLFGLPDGPGLCDVLTGRASLEEALVTLEEHQITILPAGNVPAHPAELLGTSAMRRTLETLRTQFDRVVLDAAPAAPLADVSVLAPLVDRVLLVIRAGVTTKPAIHEAVSSIDASKLLGFVLNESA